MSQAPRCQHGRAERGVFCLDCKNEVQGSFAAVVGGWKEIDARIQNYLGNGGLFNPELMEHEKVRDLLMDIRSEIVAGGLLASPNEKLTESGPLAGAINEGEQNGQLR